MHLTPMILHTRYSHLELHGFGHLKSIPNYLLLDQWLPPPHGSKVAAGCLRAWTRCKGDGIRCDVIWSNMFKHINFEETLDQSLPVSSKFHALIWNLPTCVVCPVQGGWLAHLPKHAVVIDPWHPPQDWIKADQQPWPSKIITGFCVGQISDDAGFIGQQSDDVGFMWFNRYNSKFYHCVFISWCSCV